MRFLVALILAVPLSACLSGTTRYWVGGGSSNTWAATGNTNWSTSSGGSNNAAVPGSTDIVCFDGNSGTGTSVQGTTTTIGGLDFTAYTGTLDFNAAITIDNNTTNTTTFGTSMTLSLGSTTVLLDFTGTGTHTLTANANTLGEIEQDGTGTLELGSSLTATEINLVEGTFNSENYAITLTGEFSSTGSNTRTVTLGTSTLTLSGTGTVFNITGSGITVNASSSTIDITDTSSTGKTFAGLGKTYGALNTSGGTGTVTLTGANTFSTFTPAAGSFIVFPSSTTTTFTTFVGTGSSGNLITITASTSGTQATISQASGNVSATYLSLKDSAATGGATWNCTSCTNVSDNTGWNFLGFVANQSVIMVGP